MELTNYCLKVGIKRFIIVERIILMRFTILSHASLLVTGKTASLIIDPWLAGSTYWRSWWNYPPVSSALLAGLKPRFIYITHIHWDHFHGPSLRKFDRATPVIIPKVHYDRMKRDLEAIGFKNVIELAHGQSFKIEDNFKIISYHFSPIPDSALVIECEGVTLLDANDSKFMGIALRQIKKNHPRIDFVFRSHSSANGRVCYDVVDDKDVVLDDEANYIRSFAAFAQVIGARYAIPFASNHCHLHKETFKFNPIIKTPYMVQNFFHENTIKTPEVKVMLTGDSWSPEKGFEINGKGEDFFTFREQHLNRYREEKQEILASFYERESRSSISLKDFERYFRDFFSAVPFLVRLFFKGRPIRYVLHSGDAEFVYEVDLYKKKVTERVDRPQFSLQVPEIHLSTLIMKHAMAQKFCGQISISKRITFRVTRKTKKYVQALIELYNLYEYEFLPLRKLIQPRFVRSWLARWREILLYFQIFWALLVHRQFSEEQFIRKV